MSENPRSFLRRFKSWNIFYFLKWWESNSAGLYTKETAASSVIHALRREVFISAAHEFYYTAARQVTSAAREGRG
jgi:hypothetical protein